MIIENNITNIIPIGVSDRQFLITKVQHVAMVTTLNSRKNIVFKNSFILKRIIFFRKKSLTIKQIIFSPISTINKYCGGTPILNIKYNIGSVRRYMLDIVIWYFLISPVAIAPYTNVPESNSVNVTTIISCTNTTP